MVSVCRPPMLSVEAAENLSSLSPLIRQATSPFLCWHIKRTVAPTVVFFDIGVMIKPAFIRKVGASYKKYDIMCHNIQVLLLIQMHSPLGCKELKGAAIVLGSTENDSKLYETSGVKEMLL